MSRGAAPKWLRVGLPIAVVAIGLAGAAVLKMTRPQAERTETPKRGTLVEVTEVKRAGDRVWLHAQGEVKPTRQTTMTPEVQGRVVWQSDDLVPGGQLEAGQALLQIDRRDYELAVEQQSSQVEQAREVDVGQLITAVAAVERVGEHDFALRLGRKPNRWPQGGLARLPPRILHGNLDGRWRIGPSIGR